MAGAGLKAISSDVVADETLGPVYRVRVALDRQAMEVEGRMVPLAPGMTATVNIRTGKRRLNFHHNVHVTHVAIHLLFMKKRVL